MKILILGGTRLTGPHIVGELAAQGHEVTVFHRGQTQAILPESVEVMYGERRQLPDYHDDFRRLAPDRVIDMLAYTREDAEQLMAVFRGLTDRVIVASSIDVYLAYGRLSRSEPGPPIPVPQTENSPLRQKLSPRGEAYEKRWVEEVVGNDPDLPGTILRLPAIYGPGDYQYRVYPFLKRMDDGRETILISEELAAWRFSLDAAVNVAHAMALATTNDRAAGRIYNVGNVISPSQQEWLQYIAQAAGWKGEVVTVPNEQLPESLQDEADFSQDWLIDIGRIWRELGYKERLGHAEAIAQAVEWTRANPPDSYDSDPFDYAAEDAFLATM